MLCNVLAQGLVPRLTIPQTGNAARRGLEAGEEGAPRGFLVHGGRAGGGEAQRAPLLPEGKGLIAHLQGFLTRKPHVNPAVL